jgi:CHAT domain-containing protein/tetratricopeptide (TPR) repeat protein
MMNLDEFPTVLGGCLGARKLQTPRTARVVFNAAGLRGLLAAGAAVLVILMLSVPAGAQEGRWRELVKRANELRESGKYGEAVPIGEEAVRVAEKTFGGNHPALAMTLNLLGAIYDDEGKYSEAEPLFKRGLAIREKALGPDNPEVARSLNSLAFVYYHEGRYAEAEPLFRRALAIRERALGPENAEVAVTLNMLASVYQRQGEFAKAETLFKRSLAIREKVLAADDPELARSLVSVATLYQEQGNYAEAEPLLRRSAAIREKALGPEHPDVAASLNALALVCEQQGKYAEAVPLYRRSLAIREKALGPEHPYVARSLGSLATLYEKLGEYSDAEPLFKRALAIREKALGAEHPDVASSLNNLARNYENQGKYADAEPLFKRSLAIREKVLGHDHPEVGFSLSNLATLYYAEGNSAQAEAYFEPALQNISKQFESSFTYMSEKDRLEFLSTVRPTFDAYMSFCLARCAADAGLVGSMYDLLLWEKGIVGTSVAAMRAQVADGGDAEAVEIFDRLAAKKSESARLASARPDGWEQSQKKVDDEANDLEQQLARRASSIGDQRSAAHASWRDVQKKLQPGEAAVEIVRFHFNDGKHWTRRFNYVALIVTAQSEAAPTLVALGEARELEGDPLRDYRMRVGLRANGTARGVAAEPVEENSGAAPKVSFYDAFWKPLEPALKGVDRIYLSPDGALNQVAIGDVAGGDGRLLMEKYDLRIVSSTKDILRAPRKDSSANDTAVLVGNPAFDLDEAQERAAIESLHAADPAAAHAAPELRAEAASLRSRDLTSGTLKPLPGTQAEVEGISSLLEKDRWRVQVYTQQKALKEAVMEVKGPRVLHLATHGFFEADEQKPEQKVEQTGKGQSVAEDRPAGLEDPMLRSGLYFAGANRRLSGQAGPADLDDGVLTAYEASQIDLQGTELVVLSACETGLGELAAGEGVFGLRRALQVAGADSVLMSMWAVPDKETQELMALFYEKWLAGKDKHVALREAELEMRARVKSRYGEDRPQYWGAFVLVGQ